MPDSLLVYRGDFNWETPYAPGEVVSVPHELFEFRGQVGELRVRSAGGLYVCSESTTPDLFIDEAIALPGEVSREMRLTPGSPWHDLPLRPDAPFDLCFPTI